MAFFSLQEDILALITAFEDRGSPYAEDSGHLVDLGYDTIYPKEVVNGLRSLDNTGCVKVSEFVSSRIQATGESQLPFMATIHRSNVPIMSSKLKATSSECKPIIEKEDKDISIVLLHALKSGWLINKDLFSRENCSFPPRLQQQVECFMDQNQTLCTVCLNL